MDQGSLGGKGGTNTILGRWSYRYAWSVYDHGIFYNTNSEIKLMLFYYLKVVLLGSF